MRLVDYIKKYKEGGGNEITPEYYKRLAEIESSNNPLAQASTSSAAGLYQFTEGTWKSLVNKAGLEYTLEDRFDPEKSKEVVEIFTNQNRNYISNKIGKEPSQGELYLTHFLGMGTAGKFLENTYSNPDINVDKIVPNSALKANKSIFYNKDGSPKKLRDVYNWASSKFGEGEFKTPAYKTPPAVSSDLDGYTQTGVPGRTVTNAEIKTAANEFSKENDTTQESPSSAERYNQIQAEQESKKEETKTKTDLAKERLEQEQLKKQKLLSLLTQPETSNEQYNQQLANSTPQQVQPFRFQTDWYQPQFKEGGVLGKIIGKLKPQMQEGGQKKLKSNTEEKESYGIKDFAEDAYQAWFNPKNWGVEDYTNKGSKDAAYVAARKAGEKEFMWRNQRFNTLNSGTPQQQFNMYGNTDELINSKSHENNKEHILTDAKNFETGREGDYIDRRLNINKMAGHPKYKNTITQKDWDDWYNSEELSKEDILKTSEKILGGPRPRYNAFFNTIIGGRHIAEEAHGYRNTQEGSEVLAFLKDYIKDPFITSEGQLRGYSNKEHFEFDTHNIVEPILNDYLGGIIEKEEIPFYIELLRNNKDKISTPEEALYSPYSNKSPKRRIQELQLQLHDQGYDLPKSTKEDDTFDGIWGDETKNALLEFRKSQNKLGQ